jgi:hypothetical protein
VIKGIIFDEQTNHASLLYVIYSAIQLLSTPQHWNQYPVLQQAILKIPVLNFHSHDNSKSVPHILFLFSVLIGRFNNTLNYMCVMKRKDEKSTVRETFWLLLDAQLQPSPAQL